MFGENADCVARLPWRTLFHDVEKELAFHKVFQPGLQFGAGLLAKPVCIGIGELAHEWGYRNIGEANAVAEQEIC